MAKPQILQQLSHGKLLTKGSFPQFVETYNYIVNRCQNLKGDGDVYEDGLLEVDNSNPEFPVIRCNYDNLQELADVPPDASILSGSYVGAGIDGLSSIQYRVLSGDTIGTDKVLELYRFDANETTVPLSDDSFVVRRNNSYIDYVSMSSLLSSISSVISGGGDGEVTLSGTDGSSHKGSEFMFNAAANTNLCVAIDATGNITVGVYYI